MKDIAKTYALINEALRMIQACLNVVVKETKKLNDMNREAIDELKRRKVPNTVDELLRRMR